MKIMKKQKSEAHFMTEKEEQTERFKYYFTHYWRGSKIYLESIRHKINFVAHKIVYWAGIPNYKKIFQESLIWLLEVFIEGLTANFATHYLFQITFTIPIIFAHGIIINQSLSIIRRIVEITNGSNTKLPPEQHDDKT